MQPAQRAIRSRSLLGRQRAQLGGALILAVLLPLLVRMSVGPTADFDDLASAAGGNFIAVVLGHYIVRSLTAYPGITSGAYVFPSFAASYSIVLIVFLGFRLEYSRFLFAVGSVICMGWYVTIFLLAQRRRTMRIGVVPFGATDALYRIEAIQWKRLSRPSAADIADVDALAADFRADLPADWVHFLTDCALRGTLVYHHKQLNESLTGRVEIDHLSENTFGSLIPAFVYVKLKQTVDFVAAVVAGVLLLPLLLAVAAAIKLDSRGPVLFRQTRIGYGGAAFRVAKFRTMVHNADVRAAAGRDQAITVVDDPRITRLGRTLRKTRIDELPQILNILKGEMSWIGPRPEAEVLSNWYEAELPFYRYRHVVRPGISGWAQVNQGHVSDVDQVLGKLHYDFYYIKYFSPWLDLLIVFRSVATMVTGFGAR